MSWGRLIIIAKLGELLPAKQGQRTDLTSLPKVRKLGLSGKALSAYRKVARWRDKIDAYCPGDFPCILPLAG